MQNIVRAHQLTVNLPSHLGPRFPELLQGIHALTGLQYNIQASLAAGLHTATRTHLASPCKKQVDVDPSARLNLLQATRAVPRVACQGRQLQGRQSGEAAGAVSSREAGPKGRAVRHPSTIRESAGPVKSVAPYFLPQHSARRGIFAPSPTFLPSYLTTVGKLGLSSSSSSSFPSRSSHTMSSLKQGEFVGSLDCGTTLVFFLLKRNSK
jgi:hypothetical protein